MECTRSVTLRLDVVLDAQPLTGELSAAGLGNQRFCGWTDLFASLDAALAALRSAREPLKESQTASTSGRAHARKTTSPTRQ